ncbi:MAG: alkaline phosphatase family protein, partial [Mycobacteriales bacterium]
MRKLPAVLALASAVLAGTAPALAAAPPAAGLPPVKHVWVVVLENKSYAQSFSPLSKAPALQSLARKGALLEQYYGIAHFSLPNYLALLSGQGPNVATQSDCQLYTDFVTAGPLQADGQAPGQGCVYPTSVPNLTDLLEARGTSWKGYLEDLGASTTRQVLPCGTPKTDALGRDQSQSASATDQYAARHNPFAYFHSVTDKPARCRRHLAGMPSLARDLRSVATTPAFSFVTPNLCDDGHDTGCAGTDVAGDKTGNLTAVQHWLSRYVPP